ncbi:MAG: hypothetical protein HWD60_01270 [Defluviicoccus sp.]|nr:MAG: hypothetical protein HWD60_01270 [Defluviicoccus sp.]
MLNEALDVARTISDEPDRANALTALALHIAEEERSDVLDEALGIVRTISYGWQRANALKALARS